MFLPYFYGFLSIHFSSAMFLNSLYFGFWISCFSQFWTFPPPHLHSEPKVLEDERGCFVVIATYITFHSPLYICFQLARTRELRAHFCGVLDCPYASVSRHCFCFIFFPLARTKELRPCFHGVWDCPYASVAFSIEDDLLFSAIFLNSLYFGCWISCFSQIGTVPPPHLHSEPKVLEDERGCFVVIATYITFHSPLYICFQLARTRELRAHFCGVLDCPYASVSRHCFCLKMVKRKKEFIHF